MNLNSFFKSLDNPLVSECKWPCLHYTLSVDLFSNLRCPKPPISPPLAQSIIPRHTPLLSSALTPSVVLLPLSLKMFTTGYVFKGIGAKLQIPSMLAFIITGLCHIQRNPLDLFTILSFLWMAHSACGISHLPSWRSDLEGKHSTGFWVHKYGWLLPKWQISVDTSFMQVLSWHFNRMVYRARTESPQTLLPK